MSKPNDGGPVHPVKGFVAGASGALCRETVTHAGMTLRQWYAGMALPEVMHGAARSERQYELFAKAAFQIADAMIRAEGGES